MMREKWKKYVEKFKSLGDKVSGVKGITAIIPAVCLAVLMVTVLTGYKTPQAKKYEASEAEDISQIKEAFAKESTAAMAETTKKNTTKKGKKGAIDVKDGTYKGSANGYGGKVTVNVTVSKKTMTAIDVVSAPGETDSFFQRAKGVIDEMLTAQSTDVDVVSGATYSSNGIIGAVKNALFGTESNNATAANAGNAGGSVPSVSKVSESGTWKDGTYTGSGKGFGGTISVKVTVKDGKISAIDVTSASGETASYFSKAKGIIPKMISGQTTNVDAASGATYSSNGIITAVRNALSKAETGKSSTKKKKKKNKKNKKKNSGSDSNNNNNIAAPAEGYEDGTYTGSAACSGEQFKEYSVTANVTIKNGKISAVEISSTAKGTNLKQFMSRDEIKNLPSLIVSKNGTSGVDAVSGATYSSHAIFNAVNDALSKAKKNSSSTEKKEETTTEKKEETTTEKKEETTTEKKEETTTEKKEETTTEKKEETTENPDEGKNYKNGTYKVSITCEPDEDEDFDPYTISMDITIKKDKITEISNITANTNSTNKAYTNDAKKGMISKIIANGNADGVNTVAGATCSSKAIKDACQKAFNAAKK
ncbi:FMN-binding protein [Anaerobutyricum soehngenii]|uniref:FMN-binding protein n=1 Tax=Anaerobutyricum soehngenii TaxID=105843 RepID=A0ABS3ZGA1_9FIRM|nr:FMN-binding protein [Anaerobutyricum soehngenii]MBP0055944.1 FMN-binding protein [Anaerobutyricum soehngenii]